jgi:hypothetical protein
VASTESPPPVVSSLIVFVCVFFPSNLLAPLPAFVVRLNYCLMFLFVFCVCVCFHHSAFSLSVLRRSDLYSTNCCFVSTHSR